MNTVEYPEIKRTAIYSTFVFMVYELIKSNILLKFSIRTHKNIDISTLYFILMYDST